MAEKETKQTLFTLKKSFIEVLKSSNGKMIELSTVEKKLGVNKRRLYDIANVLAGIGFIERSGKSLIKWVGKSEINNLDEISEEFDKKEKELDEMIDVVENLLNLLVKSEDFENYAWLEKDDLNLLNPSQYLSMMGIRGPKLMNLNMTNDNDEYYLHCSTESGQIEMIPLNWN